MIDLIIDIEKRLTGHGRDFVLDVSFRTDARTTVIFGPSGAGKTTLLRSVAGLNRPDRGRIALGDRVFFDSVRDVMLPPFDRRLGMIFQQPSLFPHLSALDNVLYGSPRRDRREAEELLEKFHVSHVAGRRPIHLSGGEQQRVAIARALAARPRLLLLDEPLPGVDAGSRALVLKDLLDYQKENYVPYLYVTHNRVEALRLADRALLIDRGRVVAEGRGEEILQSPVSSEAARVLGVDNVFTGRVQDHHLDKGLSEIGLGDVSIYAPHVILRKGTAVAVTIPSTDIILSVDPVPRTSARNVVSGRVDRLIEKNGAVEVIVKTPLAFRAHISRFAMETLKLRPGASVQLLIKAIAVVIEPL
jgi:molybdate transport system ATP-binding protein